MLDEINPWSDPVWSVLHFVYHHRRQNQTYRMEELLVQNRKNNYVKNTWFFLCSVCNNFKYSNVLNSSIYGARHNSSVRTVLLEAQVSHCERTGNQPAVRECCIMAKVVRVVFFSVIGESGSLF